MTYRTGRTIASDDVALRVKPAIANRGVPAEHSEREPAKAIARLRKRSESRVEKELDAFWDNVPI
jgi:hypothetical protein